MKKYLYQAAEDFGISVTDAQLDMFQKYYDHLIEVNRVMNLTTITDEKEVVIKHFLDSISVMKYYPFQNVSRMIDVGTGAGFPGVPLAILLPDISFTLMDSLNKRIHFLGEVKDICRLDNLQLIHGRAEELGRDKDHREKYDVCVSRAVADLSVLLEYCIPFVKKDGSFISYKSISVTEELLQSAPAQKILCCKLKDKVDFQLGASDYSRCLLFFKKYDSLSKKYPRQNGIPKKKPLS